MEFTPNFTAKMAIKFSTTCTLLIVQKWDLCQIKKDIHKVTSNTNSFEWNLSIRVKIHFFWSDFLDLSLGTELKIPSNSLRVKIELKGVKIAQIYYIKINTFFRFWAKSNFEWKIKQEWPFTQNRVKNSLESWVAQFSLPSCENRLAESENCAN